MKNIIWLMMMVMICQSPLLADEITQAVSQQVQAVLNKLRNASADEKYDRGRFTRDLKEIKVSEALLEKVRMSPDNDPLEIEMLALALAVSQPKVDKMIDEIEGWYGCYSDELSEELSLIKWPNTGKDGRPTYEERKELRKQAGRARLQNVERLREEHIGADYLPAWKFWLMAPPSEEKGMMIPHIAEALRKISDESVIPLMLETMRIELERVDARKRKDVLITFVNLIAEMPCEAALVYLLDINRYAIANGLNGEDYFQSISRLIIRRLASRRAYADQLIDPKMKAVIERQGHNEKPEDIPLTDEFWKIFKPHIEARLSAKTDETQQADIELMESALEIMPKK